MTRGPAASLAAGGERDRGEWREGWRIVLGCALASGTGVSLLFFTFSMLLLPMAREFHVTRGEFGTIQALIITAALGSPLIGRLVDLWGFRPVYFGCTAIIAAVEIVLARFANNAFELGACIALIGFFGVGTTAVTTTRPVSAHFRTYRGTALGLVAVGVSLTTMAVPPLLQLALEQVGWRGGIITLAMISVVIGVPAVTFLLPRNVGHAGGATRRVGGGVDRGFLATRDFWLMVCANIAMSLATAGAISQLSPMIQEEGVGPRSAALALSIFAVGQFAGRLGGGWLLDRLEPRLVAVGLTIVPGLGFVLLLLGDGVASLALVAAGMIGLLQGAELDIFAYFVARRFPVVRYGTIYGALSGLGWIGNASGIVGVGLLHDHFGSYAPAQVVAVLVLILGALFILPVRVDARASSPAN